MGQHPSLRSGSKSKQHRSVLKRFEKIEILKKKGLWKEGEDSVFGLPKVKVVRFKVKKEKAQEAAAEGAQPAAEGAPVAEQKPKTPGKESKTEPKKKTEKS